MSINLAVWILVILAFLFFLALVAVVIILFGIWRAILTKNGVELKLSTSMDRMQKTVENLTKNTNGVGTLLHGMTKKIEDNSEAMTRVIDTIQKNAQKK